MSDVSGIPNMGFGGGGYFGGSAALGLPAMSSSQINSSMGWNPNAAQFNPWANTPGGFGGQTDYYSGLGAAFGRATGGFNAPSIWQTGTSAFNPYGGGANPGGFSPSPNYPGGGGGDSGGGMTMGNDGQWRSAEANSQGYGGYSGGGIGSDAVAGRGALANIMSGYQSMYRQPAANPSYFNPATYAGSQGNYGIPFNGRPMAGDIGASPQARQMPNLGYNPGMSNWFANPGMGGGAFQGRFGMGFPGAGTPSQVAPNYGETLTPMDRLGIPFRGFGDATVGGGGA